MSIYICICICTIPLLFWLAVSRFLEALLFGFLRSLTAVWLQLLSPRRFGCQWCQCHVSAWTRRTYGVHTHREMKCGQEVPRDYFVHILFTYHPIDKWQDGRTYECKSTSQCHVPSQNQFRICHTWNDRTPVTLNMLEVKISKVTACSRSKGPNCSWLSGQKPSTRQKNTACLNAQSMWFAPQSSNHTALLRHFHGALSNYITLNSETPTDTRKRPSIRENTRMNANLALTSASPSTFLYTLDRVIENFGLQAQATAASKFLRQCTPMCFDLAVIQPLGDRTLRAHTHTQKTQGK